MQKVLLTGMSGVGKSTILNQLKVEGFLTVDLDNSGWINYDVKEEDYLMDTTKIIDFITLHEKEVVFLAGTTINQIHIYPYLDFVISLTAPLEVMKERIQNRENNPFGKTEDEWSKIVSDKVTFEEQIFKSSDYVISTDKPLQDVLKEIYEACRIDLEKSKLIH